MSDASYWFDIVKGKSNVPGCVDDGCQGIYWSNGARVNWTSDMLTFRFGQSNERCSVLILWHGQTEVHDAPCDWSAHTMCELDCENPIESEEFSMG